MLPDTSNSPEQGAQSKDAPAQLATSGLGDSSPQAATENQPSPNHPRFTEVYGKWKQAEAEKADLTRRLAEAEMAAARSAPSVVDSSYEGTGEPVDLKAVISEASQRAAVTAAEAVVGAQQAQAQQQQFVAAQKQSWTALVAKYPDLNNPTSELYKTADAIKASSPGLQGVVDGDRYAVEDAARMLGLQSQVSQEGALNQQRSEANLATGGHDLVVAPGGERPSAETLDAGLEQARKDGSVEKFFMDNAKLFIPPKKP